MFKISKWKNKGDTCDWWKMLMEKLFNPGIDISQFLETVKQLVSIFDVLIKNLKICNLSQLVMHTIIFQQMNHWCAWCGFFFTLKWCKVVKPIRLHNFRLVIIGLGYIEHFLVLCFVFYCYVIKFVSSYNDKTWCLVFFYFTVLCFLSFVTGLY